MVALSCRFVSQECEQYYCRCVEKNYQLKRCCVDKSFSLLDVTITLIEAMLNLSVFGFIVFVSGKEQSIEKSKKVTLTKNNVHDHQ